MHMTSKIRWGLATALVVLTAGIALADPEAVIYRALRGTAPAAQAAQSTATSVQSASWASPVSPVRTNGNPSVAVFGSFSDTDESGSGQTAGVTVGLYHEEGGNYTFLGIAGVGTLTGSFVELNGTRAPAVAPLSFDTRAATVYDVRLRAVPASGNVTLVHYPYGGAARPGE